MKDKFVNSLNDYVGSPESVNLNWKVLFSDVFKHHTKDEAEAIFICGTKSTTPAESDVSREWPHPWLYSRVLLAFMLAFFFLCVCVIFFQNANALPGMIVVGSFAMPLAIMILFMEVNVWRDISMYEIIRTFLVGGCASLVAALFLFEMYPIDVPRTLLQASMVGLIEEIGKAIIVYIFIRSSKATSILSGMLIGASVGAGFAAFESAGYAMQPILASESLNAVYHSIFLRGFLAPGGHVAWAAISGAAIILAAQDKQAMKPGVFFNIKFLRLFVIPVILHGIWDSPFSALLHYMLPYSSFIGLTIIVWVVIMILINYGLSEVNWHYRTFISFRKTRV